MSLPKPVRSIVPHENPINAAADYANQVLAGINSGTSTTPQPNIRQPRGFGQSSLPQRTVEDRVDMIRQGAQNQHQQTLRRLQGARSPQYGVGGGRSGGGSYGPPAGGLKGNYRLSAGADAAFRRLSAAYSQKFGTPLVVNSGGRTRAEQAEALAKYGPSQAAQPGHSPHEGGIAVDLGGPILNANSQQHRWLQANAGQFGWLWTGKNFSTFEPWHWEYRG